MQFTKHHSIMHPSTFCCHFSDIWCTPKWTQSNQT